MKKILSLILALSLIISVAPMSFAIKSTELDNPPTVDATFSAKPGMYFNFSAANLGEKADIDKTTIISYDSADSLKWATVDTDPWKIAGEYGTTDYRITSSSLDTTTYANAKENAFYWSIAKNYASRIWSTGKPGSAIAIGIYVGETGVFTPSITYQESTKSCKYSFYLAPMAAYNNENGYSFNSTNVIAKSPVLGCLNPTTRSSSITLIGTQDFYNADPQVDPKTIDFSSSIKVEKEGFYYLYIVPNCNSAYLSNNNQTDYYMNLCSIKFTPEPEMTADAAFTATTDPDYSSETAPTTATVSRLALYGETSANIDTETVTYGSTTTIKEVYATVTREDGTYNFLYWAKGLYNGVGNKHILSTSNAAFSYKPHEGANYLIAVYEKEGAAKEAAFYDRNGQLLNPEITDNTLPALPAMAGLGDAIGWEQLGTGEVFAAGFDFSALEGDKVFMAKYNELSEDITISINGVSDTYKYGDTVTCESDNADFSYWTRQIGSGDAEIVSIDADYSFSAYTDCTIKAVCNGAVTEDDLSNGARKILLSTFSVGDNLTAVMAEFIGFGGAKEKGIMFGEKKIAMTTDKAQFTVTNDTTSAVTVTGYAIVDEAGAAVKYTDGSISVPGVTSAE
ncbi:MAG: hypothetical protein IJN09_06780 [Oscillospiraceae bacterium]|nr:hypothetical protein [Oscillospiraceae bacterium]